MAYIKTMTIDGFYTKEEAINISNSVYHLQFANYEFGQQIDNFNMIGEHYNEMFSKVLNKDIEIIEERSGIFRIPERFIHFESFDDVDEWMFVVALQNSTFDICEHKSGSRSALESYNFNYRNLFEWEIIVNHQLQPGQGIFFRPWLFHSFDNGLIQVFHLREKNAK